MTPILSSKNSASCEDELKHIDQWATDNNLRLNQAKTVEIVFYVRGRHRAEDEQPLSLPGSQRVNSIRVLGVTISNNVSMAGHVSALFDTCVRTLYGLRVLRAHGLHQDCLDVVFRCTVLAKLLCASPAWSGFCSAADNGKLDRFLNNEDISELFSLADQSLFPSLSSIAYYQLNQHSLTIVVLAVTVFPLLKNTQVTMTVISSTACYFTISTD